MGSLNRPEASWRRIVAQARAAQPGPLLQVAVYEDVSGTAGGFVNYTTEVRWNNDLTDGIATVHQMVALTREAHMSIWDHLLRLDMMERLVVERFWVDDPVQHLLADPRRLQWTPHDDLHLRVVDPVAALSARRYAREDALVIEVRDSSCADIEGRYRVEGGLDSAYSQRTTADADLVMDAAALGSIYLGDVSVAALHTSGLVEENRVGAVQRASAMFAWHPRPHLTYMF
ncbi:MAG: sterol carrier protein domain-containing protein [Candidatus Dormibacteria bacterium]